MSSKISFQSLSVDDKYDALEEAADRLESDPYLLAEDYKTMVGAGMLFNDPSTASINFELARQSRLNSGDGV